MHVGVRVRHYTARYSKPYPEVYGSVNLIACKEIALYGGLKRHLENPRKPRIQDPETTWQDGDDQAGEDE